MRRLSLENSASIVTVIRLTVFHLSQAGGGGGGNIISHITLTQIAKIPTINIINEMYLPITFFCVSFLEELRLLLLRLFLIIV